DEATLRRGAGTQYPRKNNFTASVAHALVRAMSRLVSTHLCATATKRRHERRRGTHECVRHGGQPTKRSSYFGAVADGRRPASGKAIHMAASITPLETLSFEQVRGMLAHRFPFLMIDRVMQIERGKRLRALKHVTGNELCFLGHFPDHAIFPGVLILEAMAQS